MNDTNIEHTILNCLTKVSQSFLNDDMKIEVIDTNSIEKYDIINYYLGSVKFTQDNINIICIVSMDKLLFDTIFKVFFPEEISQEEYDELALALPDEIVNTVAGLSISEFPTEYEDLEMSVPLAFKKSALKILKQNGRFISKEIKTAKGSFVCSII
ncbi:MAG: hypothetical protein U9R16_00790 [Campylobacterota bacterium]|nr:hypothetical protein [Campylobacterota bacterium]